MSAALDLGTTTLFAAFNILNGKVIGSCLPRHRGKEFIKFLNQLEKEVPSELDIHLIVDNYSTHKSAAVQRWLKPRKRRRFHFHFTPTSSSWLNQVERWFGLITEKMIRRGTFHSVDELERAIYLWLANWNHKPKAFVWKVVLQSVNTGRGAVLICCESADITATLVQMAPLRTRGDHLCGWVVFAIFALLS